MNSNTNTEGGKMKVEMTNEEAAIAAAKFQEVPVSRIEDVDVGSKSITYWMTGKAFTMSVKTAIGYLAAPYVGIGRA